jgi:hypothetical protein
MSACDPKRTLSSESNEVSTLRVQRALERGQLLDVPNLCQAGM